MSLATVPTLFICLAMLAQAEARREWYRNYDLAAERDRGLDHREDHLLAAVFKARLAPGGSVTFAFSTDPKPQLENRAALTARENLDQKLLEYWIAAHPRAALEAPHWIWQLVLAAAQFAARRRTSDGARDGRLWPATPGSANGAGTR